MLLVFRQYERAKQWRCTRGRQGAMARKLLHDFRTAAILLAVTSAWPAASLAQSFPTQTIRIVLPVPAGGVADALARGLAFELGKKWKSSPIVENRAGGAGVVAASVVRQSAPDGHTILMANSTQFIATTLMVSPTPYDPVNDFVPVIGLVRIEDVLLASPQSSIKSVRQLIDVASAAPGRLNYGSFGAGSSTHLDAESLLSVAKIKATHVPFKGGAEVLGSLTTGVIDFGFTGLTAAIPLIQEGNVIALAYSGRQRVPVLPTVPTLAEQGLEVAAGGWFGWFVPRNTPKEIVSKISDDTKDVLSNEEFQKRFIIPVGLEPFSVQGEEITALLKHDTKAYAALIQNLGLGPGKARD
jgi:tripartite-type tricarboxylate transporter receptor subunit TctC